MSYQPDHSLTQTRRHFFGSAGLGLGAAALGTLLRQDLAVAANENDAPSGLPHFTLSVS